MKRIFIARDFEIKEDVEGDCEFAQRNLPVGCELDWAGEPSGKQQGAIWNDRVRPAIQEASHVISYVDLPNANVGFEIGYALGCGKGVALARKRGDIPEWLNQPPFSGFFCSSVQHGGDLVKQIESDKNWKTISLPNRGGHILSLCPPEAGYNYLDLLDKNWRRLPPEGWSLDTLPELLAGIGGVLWLIVPHNEGEMGRDGKENAAASVVAGFAEGFGLKVIVLKHAKARRVQDVAPRAREFSNATQFTELLLRAAEELDQLLQKPSEPATEVLPVERPAVGDSPILDTSVLSQRFIGRQGLLDDLRDALRGLDSRSRSEPTQGGAKVQAFWYHGFGGMGKSWFLRRAILEMQQRVPSAKVALVDWDLPTWRVPLTQPARTPNELLEPIAYRLAQLYGVQPFDRYWKVVQRVRDSNAERSSLKEAFKLRMRNLEEGKETDSSLRQALKKLELWPEDRKPGEKLIALRDALEDERMNDQLFIVWFEKGGGKADDPDAVLRPEDLCVRELQACMRTVSAQVAPLVLVLDTCEVLPAELENWLRQLISPICDGKTPMLALFGSRLAPDAGIEPGSRDVWRSAVGEERWRRIPFDEGVRFTVDEIELAVGRVMPPVHDTDILAKRLHRITLGVPLALQCLLDMHEDHSTVLSEIETLDFATEVELEETEAQRKVVETVANRFLLHLQGRLERGMDFKRIISLALLPKAEPKLLKILWSDAKPRERMRELANRYSLLASNDLDLHETVRRFLRRHWRSEERPKEVDEVIEALYNAVKNMELPGSPGDVSHMNALVLRLNAIGWREEGGSLAAFAPAISLALAYDEQIDMIIGLAAELPDTDPYREVGRAIRWLKDHPLRAELWGSDMVLAWLEEEERKGKWAPAERAALDLLRGWKRRNEGKYDVALQPLRAALVYFEKHNIPQRVQFGEALFDVGYALVNTKGHENEAEAAYEGALRLEYSKAFSHNNLGVILKRLARFQEAAEHYHQAILLNQREALFPRNMGNLFVELKPGEAVGWYKRALQIYQKAMELDPREPGYPYNVGNLLRQSDQLEDPERWYRKALELDPKYAAAWYGLGLLSEARKEPAKAREHYEKAAELDPKEPAYPRNVGDLLRQSDQLEDAERYYRKALELDPKYAAAWYGLGLLSKARKEPAKAREHYEKAAELDPGEPAYPYDVGNLLRQSDQLEDAERYYRKALELNPKYAAAWNGLGLLSEARKEPAKAQEHYEKAAGLDPREPAYPYNVGDLLRQSDQLEDAERYYRKALELDPKYAAAWNGLGLLSEARNEPAKAREHYEKAAELDPREPAYPRNVGDLLCQSDQLEDAERWYRQALDAARLAWKMTSELADQAEIRARRIEFALALTNCGFHSEAVQHMEAVVAETPFDAGAICLLGHVLYEAGDYDRSLEASSRALAVNPAENVAIRNLGNAHLAKGLPDDAEREYRRAIQNRKCGENFIETIQTVKRLLSQKPDLPRGREILHLLEDEQRKLEAEKNLPVLPDLRRDSKVQ
jgi:tetratricopeptide (TPR) repeat protein